MIVLDYLMIVLLQITKEWKNAKYKKLIALRSGIHYQISRWHVRPRVGPGV